MTDESKLIQGYLQIFVDRYKISKRETDVISAVLNIKSNIKDIAESMNLSPSTVNNHLNNIYEKTGASSKAELVSRVLIESLKHYRNCNLLKKTPRVLVVDDDADVCKCTAEILAKKGIKSFMAGSTDEALAMLPEINVHFIVSDIKMPEKCGFSFLKAARESHRYNPLFIFMSAYSEYTLPEAQNLGAVTIMRKPIDYDALYDLILENYIENFYERISFLSLSNSTPILSDEPIPLVAKDIGFGGFFMNMPTRKNREVALLKPGSRIRLKFLIDDKVIDAYTEVQWIRDSPTTSLKSGYALKYLNMSEDDRSTIENYIRKNKIYSYIPLGVNA